MTDVPPLPDFEALYREHRDRVVRLCLNVTGSAASAEDAAQETFLSVYRGLSAFRGEARVSTWIFRIALRQALHARARREPELPEPLPTSPEASLEAREQVARLQRALGELPEEQRLVLSLHAVEGLRHPQIAELLGIAEGTAWSRLHAARKRLAVLLEQHET